MADDRPNVLFIMSDQHSKAVAGCYGHDIVHTPNRDRLAQRGLTYDNAFCASPLCGPSRVAWITGTQPHTNGVVTHNNSRHRSGNAYRKCIDPAVPSLVDCMRRDGYDSFGAGFMHADQHVDGDDPFGELGFANYGVSPDTATSSVTSSSDATTIITSSRRCGSTATEMSKAILSPMAKRRCSTPSSSTIA